jgi:hypothetical protein
MEVREAIYHLVMTVAVGYPDPARPITIFKSAREDVAEFLTWIG